MITIDGSSGEGGGQIIRTSLALALITGQPFAIHNIRAGRKKPGLLRQHLTAVNAARDVGNATVSGNQLGSRSLTFQSGPAQGGDYRFDVGSAGSCTLVLQAILPALMLANGPSTIVLEGGTHNPYAPPFDFLATVFLPLLSRMGPRIAATLDRHGFYPAGGGRFRVSIQPTRILAPLTLTERGRLRQLSAKAVVSALPTSIASRELRVIRQDLQLDPTCLRAVVVDSPGPGNVVSITAESEHITEVFTGFGQRGLRAEVVAKRVVEDVQKYLDSGCPVGLHLADQLLVPLALAEGGHFTTMPPTDHTRTNAAVIREFLDVSIDVRQRDDQQWDVRVAR